MLGQLNSENSVPVQVSLKMRNNARYKYNSEERVVEVTSGRVGVNVPAGYALLCHTEGVLDGSAYIRRPPYDSEFNVWFEPGTCFGLVKLSELSVSCE